MAEKNRVRRCGLVTYKSGDSQTRVTYKSLVLSHLTYKSGDLLEPNRPLDSNPELTLNQRGVWMAGLD